MTANDSKSTPKKAEDAPKGRTTCPCCHRWGFTLTSKQNAEGKFETSKVTCWYCDGRGLVTKAKAGEWRE